jgi:type VI secretion system protein VasD
MVNISVKAGPDINPDASGQGAPLVLRVYQLASSAGFGNAEFFALYKSDATTLGADIVHRDDVALNPGDMKTLTLSPTDQVKSIGFFAGLRDFSQAAWRATADVPPHLTTNITVSLTKAGIDVAAKTLPPPAKPAS